MIPNRAGSDLLKSVCQGDLKLVKYYLSSMDFSRNNSFKEQIGLLLHDATCANVAKELLNYGAEVDARNSMRETPLHSAITLGKKYVFIKELLKYGASVYASDYKGCTPLYLEVKKEKPNLQIVQILIEYGADINFQNQERRKFGIHCSALDVSIRNLTCAKLLVKYYLLQNHQVDYHSIVNLEPYKSHYNYENLACYVTECASEIAKMKCDSLDSSLTFYRFITDDALFENFHFTSNIENAFNIEKVFSKLIENKYPLYQDVIIEKLGRRHLLRKIDNSLIFADSFVTNLKKRVVLDQYSTPYVTKYLSNSDILNLIKAFND